MTERITTGGQSTLNGAINSIVTSLVVTSASSFPANPNFRIKIDNEWMLVTGVAGSTYTVTRGIEGSSAASHADLATVTEVLTAAGLAQLILEGNIIGVSGNSGSTSIGSAFTLNAATSVYQDTGLSVSLPAAGNYIVWTETTGLQDCSTGTLAVAAKLYNSTDAADIGDAWQVGYVEASDNPAYKDHTSINLITIAAAKTIKLYALRSFGGVVTTSQIAGAKIIWARLS